MRKVELDQGSEEWLKWRRGLLTATDAPVLMGVSPYATPYKIWQRKIGQGREQEETEAMRRGKRDEPIARDWFNEEYGLDMQPCCVESESYNYIGSSLDGLSACGKYILEIKSNGDQYHFGLRSGGIPDFHLMQMQHQLLSTDGQVEKGFYLSINKGEKVVIEVYPDKAWMDEYLPKAQEFWRKVVFMEAPELCQKDYRDMNFDVDWNKCADDYRKICEQIGNLEEAKENYRKQLIKLCGDDSCYGKGVKVLKRITKGRVDYEAIPELTNVDLERYRKTPTSSWTIFLDKNTI